MTKRNIIKDLEQNVFCQIKPSPIHGVGVFAIREIPKGKNPFVGAGNPRYVRVPLCDIAQNKKISGTVKKLVCSFFAVHDGTVWFPDHRFNRIDISYFMNQSKKPNIACLKNGESFRAKRRIQSGEELTINYDEFSDE